MANERQIKIWETSEIQRSLDEAQGKQFADLHISETETRRYLNPPPDTPFPLEYSYYLLGGIKDKSVLDYGCGTGENSFLLARRGANVCGIDISNELLCLAKQRMELANLAEKARFFVGSAHDLPFSDESFDVVFGMAILHHLDLQIALSEVFRVLKKGGAAIFREPVRNSKTMAFIRRLIPYQTENISPYERPLTDQEIKESCRKFAEIEMREFQLPFVNLVKILKLEFPYLKTAYQIDRRLLDSFGFLSYFSTVRVFKLTKP
jgi:SAM-dependent methyltransferase